MEGGGSGGGRRPKGGAGRAFHRGRWSLEGQPGPVWPPGAPVTVRPEAGSPFSLRPQRGTWHLLPPTAPTPLTSPTPLPRCQGNKPTPISWASGCPPRNKQEDANGAGPREGCRKHSTIGPRAAASWGGEGRAGPVCWAKGCELGWWLHATQGQASGPHVQSGGEGLLPSCTFWVLTVKTSSVGHGACTGGWAQALGCLQSHQGEVGGRRGGDGVPSRGLPWAAFQEEMEPH